ncbi:hypothetical protein [Streptomyces sp. NPDC016845]|uniref:hypothetical protein n=1 Tax=Streptomyces sp. NPDC016845 TaxID=3364972 RepID=UPI0037A904AF
MRGWRARGRTAVAVGAVLCAGSSGAFALPATAAAAGEADPYVYAKDAEKVPGGSNSTDAPRLKTGGTYRSLLGTGTGTGTSGTAYYRVELDRAANAYVSVVAVPPLGSDVKVTYSDGIAVALQDRDGNRCDSESATFRSGGYPRPVAATAERLVRPGALRCQAAGTYYVVVERKTDAGSTQESWGLELKVDTEPGLVSTVPTQGPQTWPSASVQPPTQKAVRRSGGTGFNDAVALTGGVWKDGVRPGQSHYYRVPVDWGQQLFVDAELGSSAGDGTRRAIVTGALDMELYNPARAPIAAKQASYAGDPASATFEPIPPVAYENRYLMRDDQAAMRLAGWYYLKVTLNPAMASKFGDKASGLTLRVSVEGEERQPPDYVRDPGEFQVTDEDREAAEKGEGGAVWENSEVSEDGGARGDGQGGGEPSGGTGPGGSADAGASASGESGAAGSDGASGSAGSSSASASAGSGGMLLVGVAGVGVGCALVMWLGVWRVVAVRRVKG